MDVFGEEILERKTRQPEPLKEHTQVDYFESVKKNEVDLYENEYHLIEDTFEFPKKYMELSEIEQKMVILFVDKEFVEPNSGKKTENDAFISFLASYHNQSVVKKIYKKEQKHNGFDKDGNKLYEEVIIIDPEYLPLYIKLKSHAAMLWKKNNLRDISVSMRELITNNGYRDKELLEQKIVSDALSDKRDSFTMQNRRVAIDIKGMKKPQGLQQINVFLKGGGKEANKEIVSTTGNAAYDLIPEVEEVEK